MFLTYIRQRTRRFHSPAQYVEDFWLALAQRKLLPAMGEHTSPSGVRASLSLAAATLRWGSQESAGRTPSLEESLTLTSVSFPSSTLAHGNSGATSRTSTLRVEALARRTHYTCRRRISE